MINMVITAVVIAFTSGWFSEDKKAATVEVEKTQQAAILNPVSNSKTEDSFRISMNK